MGARHFGYLKEPHKKTWMDPQEKSDLKLLRAIADGFRTNLELKRKMRKDVRGRVTALTRNGSVERRENKTLILTKRGAGRLRFAHV